MNLYIAAVIPESKEQEVKSVPKKPFDPKDSVLIYVRAQFLQAALAKAESYVTATEGLAEVVKVEKVLEITVD
jgi:hypothetical protein